MLNIIYYIHIKLLVVIRLYYILFPYDAIYYIYLSFAPNNLDFYKELLVLKLLCLEKFKIFRTFKLCVKRFVFIMKLHISV